jgi:hypothetical protein
MHGFVRDQPLYGGRVAQVMVHPPGTIVRRSEARNLGISDSDFRVVVGPQVRNLPTGFAVVLEPRAADEAPPMGRGPVVPGPGW